ncbi:MAG TPA: GntR family transcriptional regulator [Mycobacteriales bacterium]|nr:GntR family transcriptional regulator [Mycobacteriales bacterium]
MRGERFEGGVGGLGSPLDRDSPMPLWAQLRDRLTRRLDAGEFLDTFPTEAQLCAAYGVSRYTVRQALRGLRAAGRVVAEPGRGSRAVETGPIDQPLGALYSLFRAVEAAGQRSRSVVRVLDERCDRVAAGRLGLDPACPLVFLERLRLADDEPLAFDQLWMPAELAAPLLDVDFTNTAFYDELAQHCGLRVHQGGERIHALVPTAAQRRLLGIDTRTAVLRIERLATWRMRPAEWRISLVRGDRFRLSAAWSPGADYPVQAAAERLRSTG